MGQNCLSIQLGSGSEFRIFMMITEKCVIARPDPMRIAFVAPEIHKHGGTEKALAYLIEDTSKKHEITIFSIKISEFNKNVLEKIKFYKIPGFLRPVMLVHMWFFIISSIYIYKEKL